MKIVVLAGGNSTERYVSLTSGKQVYDALKENNHDVILLDVYLGYTGEISDKLFEEKRNCMAEHTLDTSHNPDLEEIKKMRDSSVRGFFGPGVIELCKMADIVFLGLHGANGEDGKLQAAFDLLDIKYTGADSVSSMLSMDKNLTKQMFIHHNIPTPRSYVLYKNKPFNQKPVKFPVVVKVTNGGSSVGVYICNNDEEFDKAKAEGFKFDDVLLVEEYIKGREFTCAVIEGRALPIVEIAPVEGFYDYKNKYVAGATVETCPAQIPKSLTKAIQQTAEDVFSVLKLSAYARMDFMVDENGKHYCLEANTLPGMTPTSLLPQEAKAEGIEFAQLCEKIVEVSMRKYK